MDLTEDGTDREIPPFLVYVPVLIKDATVNEDVYGQHSLRDLDKFQWAIARLSPSL